MLGGAHRRFPISIPMNQLSWHIMTMECAALSENDAPSGPGRFRLSHSSHMYLSGSGTEPMGGAEGVSPSKHFHKHTRI